MNFILERAAKAWRSHYDKGRMDVIESETGRAEMRLSQVPPEWLHESVLLAVKGWMIRAVELVGSEVQTYEMLMDHPEPGMVTFDCTWL